MRKLTILLVLAATSAFAQSSADRTRFDYDSKAALDIQEVAVEHRGKIEIHDISYASPKGGRVPAFLVIPAGKGPFAAVVWGHWYWPTSEFANRKEFLAEAVALAPAGVASLLVSGPIARPGYVQSPSPFTPQAADYLVQDVIDMRRGVDLLLSRKDIDPARLAYVGHSYHATIGGFLSGLDHRLKAFVLMAGDLSTAVDLRTKQFQNIRSKMGADRFDTIMAKYAWMDPGEYLAHAAPAVIFLQNATHEDFLTPEVTKQYADLISEPKRYQVYDASHALNAEARKDRDAFLVEQLKLRPIDPATIARVPDLPQPNP